MTEPLHTVVVGTDGSSGAQQAVTFAARLAAQAGLRVVLVHAFEPIAELQGEHPPEPPVDFAAIRDHRLIELAEQWAEPLIQREVEHASEVIEDRPVAALSAAATRHGADLVVIGSHGRTGWRERVFGRVALSLPYEAGCPVIIVPTTPATGGGSTGL